MLFHTWTFVLFFLVFYPVYLGLKGTRLRIPWLLLASYVFYGWWNPLYLVLILWSTSVDYLAVVAMSKGRRAPTGHRRGTVRSVVALVDWSRPWLALSIVNNLGLLGFFKYGQFVTDNVNLLLARLEIPYELPAPGFLLPVGISFYVFQSMSYTIDYYRGNVRREPNFIRYATFVSLFPQLVAGPIERAKNLLPQLQQTPKITSNDVADGLSLFVVGLFKKVALADYLAIYVNQVYDAPGEFKAPALILATFAFSWQIYFDFSGYSDMARGIARMMGIRLMLNFNNPYLATGLGDFWRRWHISLSTWFRDYVYIPLGGSRKGSFNTYRNLCLVMLISGLWHGAAWTFVIWGAVHALGYSLTRSLERTTFYKQRVPKLAKQLLTFSIVSFAWIFFRVGSLDRLVEIEQGGWWLVWYPGAPYMGLAAVFVVIVFLCRILLPSSVRRTLMPSVVRVGVATLIILYVLILVSNTIAVFQFLRFHVRFRWADPACPLLMLALILAVWLYQFVYESKAQWILKPAPVRIAAVVAMLVYVSTFAASTGQPFIYFQF